MANPVRPLSGATEGAGSGGRPKTDGLLALYVRSVAVLRNHCRRYHLRTADEDREIMPNE